MDAFFVFAAAMTIVVTIMTLLRVVAIRDAVVTRKYAQSIGINIIKCTRDTPYWTSKDFSKPPQFRKNKKSYGYCSNYKNPQSNQWSLLQRNSEPDSEFPPAWRLVIDKGEVNEKTKAYLLVLAKVYEHSFFEIVSTENTLCIYWEECGRKAMAEKIQEYLSDISALMNPQ